MTRFLLLILLSFLFIIPNQSFAILWTVGTFGSDYPSPNALYMADQDGDIAIADYDSIYIYEQTYWGTDALAAWEQNNLYIFSVLNGAHMEADGEYILGKGTWVCLGNNITIDNIEFSEAVVPDNNGAGIRLDGIGLTVRNCYFHHNENGILTSNPDDGDILIEYCEFAYNGFGDGFTHNMYIGHVNSFTLRYCHISHAIVGHNVKSRANNNYIQYNLIADKEFGNSSRLIDIPNGGYALIQGNALMQGPNALNNNAVGYGKEGLTNPVPHQFYFLYNTVINKREASCNFLDVEDGALDVYIANNIFAGTGNLLVGEATTLFYNYKHDDISHFDFEDEADYNYALKVTSPVIDSGLIIMDGLDAEYYYVHVANGAPRILHGDRPDIGAYEYLTPIGIHEEAPSLSFRLYPNPSNGTFAIETDQKIDKITIFNLLGKRVYQSDLDETTIQLDHPSGVYIVEVNMENSVIRKQLVLNQ